MAVLLELGDQQIDRCDIARGDTGGIFDLALEVGGIDSRRFWPGEALAYLRHGLDDIDDILDPEGDQADVRDRVPTLMSCFTEGTDREALLSAVPHALEWLKPFLRVAWTSYAWESLQPFFADLETMWRRLADGAARIAVT